RPGAPRVALEYSPLARLPYVSRVDAGTMELVRASGAEVLSSADLAQRFEGTLAPEARRDHRRTGALFHGIMGAAFQHARARARARQPITDTARQRWIPERCAEADLPAAGPRAAARTGRPAEAP